MPSEKLFTAKQAARAVLDKAKEIMEKSELIKSRADEGLSAQRKASQRAERNDRSYSLSDTAAPKSSLSRYHKFDDKKGALAGKPGEKVSGKPAGSHKEVGVHSGSREMPGRSAAGVNAEWAGKHKNPGHAGYARDKAVELHSKKLAELKDMPKPNLGKAEPEWKKPEKDADQHAEGKGPKGEIHPKEKEEAPSDEVRDQKDPQHNPKEQAEGNNELAGTTPNAVGEDGKVIPGFDEMRGHLKLAKFIGHMESKRKMKVPALEKGESDSERGVHRAVSSQKWGHGTSHAGSDAVSATESTRRAISGESPSPTRSLQNASAAKERAVESHKKVLGEMKNMPRPNLGKAETGHEKGVHVGYPQSTPGVSKLGESIKAIKTVPSTGPANDKLRSSNLKAQVGKVRDEQAQIKPKLPG